MGEHVRDATGTPPVNRVGVGDSVGGRGERRHLGSRPRPSFDQLRLQLARVQASWLSEGVSGIPPFIPDAFGAQFTMHLEALVEREVAKLAAKLERAYEAKQKRLKNQPSNQRLQPTAARATMKPPRLNRGR